MIVMNIRKKYFFFFMNYIMNKGSNLYISYIGSKYNEDIFLMISFMQFLSKLYIEIMVMY